MRSTLATTLDRNSSAVRQCGLTRKRVSGKRKRVACAHPFTAEVALQPVALMLKHPVPLSVVLIHANLPRARFVAPGATPGAVAADAGGGGALVGQATDTPL